MSATTKTLLENTMVHMRQIRIWAFAWYAWCIFLVLILSFGSLIILIRQPSRGRRIAHFAANTLFRLTGMPVTAKGLEHLPDTTHILLVNHTSFLDGIVLMALLPPVPGYGFTVRQQFPIQRIFCPLLKGIGVLVFNPADDTHVRTNVDFMTIALRRRKNLIVFPEGAFKREPGLMQFHSGAFVAAAAAQVPIVLAGLRGTRAALPLGSWLPRRIPIMLEIGPMIQTGATGDIAMEDVIAKARNAMAPLTGEFALP